MLAIPFFAALFLYFYEKGDQRTPRETILMIFGFFGFLADVLFVTGVLH